MRPGECLIFVDEKSKFRNVLNQVVRPHNLVEEMLMYMEQIWSTKRDNNQLYKETPGIAWNPEGATEL